jgi:hypothetical protein
MPVTPKIGPFSMRENSRLNLRFHEKVSGGVIFLALVV